MELLAFEGPCFGIGALCEAVLRLLPDWFGIEEAVRQYVVDIDRPPTFLVMDGGRALGFLSVKIHNEYSPELKVKAHPTPKTLQRFPKTFGVWAALPIL